MDGQEQNENKRYHHGNLRQALIAAGLELIAEGGAEQLDLRKVARKAGVSHAAPYRHFADKKELLAAISEEGFRDLAAHIHAVCDQFPPDQAMATVRAFAQEYVRFGVNNPWLMREMFSGMNIEFRSYPALFEQVRSVFSPIVELLRNGQQKGEFAGNDVLDLLVVIWSMLHGLTTLLIENKLQKVLSSPENLEYMIELCVQTLFHGLVQKSFNGQV